MNAKHPAISIVIPAHNEELFLPLCLSSIRMQDFYQPYEVIVVDNASTDQTARIARRFGARVIAEPILGLSRACQTGFAHARAPIIARTDADTIVPRHWLAHVYEAFAQEPKLVGLTGPVYPLEANVIERIFFYPACVLWMLFERAMGFGYFYANMAARTWAYKMCGGFDPIMKFGEDAYIGKQLSQIGAIRIVYSCFIFASARRVRAHGLVHYLVHYVFANYLRTWIFRMGPGDIELVRLAPCRTVRGLVPATIPVPRYPTVWACALPTFIPLVCSGLLFFQTQTGVSVAREVIADTRGAVSKPTAHLRRGVTFLKNIRENGLRYYHQWNRKESSHYPHQFPTNHQA